MPSYGGVGLRQLDYPLVSRHFKSRPNRPPRARLEHHSEQDRPAEIDGILGDHVSTKTLDDLVEYAVVVEQQNLLETENPAGSSETDSVSAHSE